MQQRIFARAGSAVEDEDSRTFRDLRELFHFLLVYCQLLHRLWSVLLNPKGAIHSLSPSCVQSTSLSFILCSLCQHPLPRRLSLRVALLVITRAE